MKSEKLRVASLRFICCSAKAEINPQAYRQAFPQENDGGLTNVQTFGRPYKVATTLHSAF